MNDKTMVEALEKMIKLLESIHDQLDEIRWDVSEIKKKQN